MQMRLSRELLRNSPADFQLILSFRLQEKQALEWGGAVKILFGDMRQIDVPELADVIVSELLGSFGDNELSPECLDGAGRFLKRTHYVGRREAMADFNNNYSGRHLDSRLVYRSSRSGLLV